jgi:hypothetical protein
MKLIKRVAIVVGVLFLLWVGGVGLTYPWHWLDIKPGMPDTEVLRILGENASTSARDLKGDYCKEAGAGIYTRIFVIYDDQLHVRSIRRETFMCLNPFEPEPDILVYTMEWEAGGEVQRILELSGC